MPIKISCIGHVNADMLLRVGGAYYNGKIQDAEARNNNPDLPALEIDLFVNSFGGDPGTAFALHNMLRATGLQINAYNIGECSSAATMPFLAGHKRYASKYSFFKFHPMVWDLSSSGQQAAARIQDVHVSLQTMHDLWGQLIKERTKLSEEEISGFFARTVCFTPDQALASGLIDQVKEPPIG